jgi:CheY-like chemotaxis protein
MKPISPVVVVISRAAEDRLALLDILHGLECELLTFATLREAVSVLGRACVVLCDAELPDATWRDVLYSAEAVPDPPRVVVADRFADDRLWAEVLNEGGHDVLAKPFLAAEVLHSLTSTLRRRDTKAMNIQKPNSKAATS